MTETAAAVVAGGSRVRLRDLSQRPDGDGWVIGRVETGDFVSVPGVAHRAITLLGQGHRVDEVTARLQAETGTRFAVADFVAALDELGFIAAVDDRAREEPGQPGPSLPWLRPGYVRWLLHPLIPVVPACFVLAIVAMLALHPALVPRPGMLTWSRHAGLALAVDVAIGCVLIVAHELAHLASARAAGVPARITVSTRLQYLAAQTDVSGVWTAPRRTRMTVYLAGISVNICVAGMALLILGLGGPHGLARQLLAVTATMALLSLLYQCMVFMRTDVYFVLQDLSGCANLYADGCAYLRHLGRRAIRPIRPASGPSPDPSLGYPPRQRRAVRAYSLLLAVGTVICLGAEFAVSLPALIVFVVRAAAETGGTPAAAADGSVALAIVATWQVLWASRWWHRHRHHVRSVASRYRGRERR